MAANAHRVRSVVAAANQAGRGAVNPVHIEAHRVGGAIHGRRHQVPLAERDHARQGHGGSVVRANRDADRVKFDPTAVPMIPCIDEEVEPAIAPAAVLIGEECVFLQAGRVHLNPGRERKGAPGNRTRVEVLGGAVERAAVPNHAIRRRDGPHPERAA